MLNFNEFGLRPEILQAISELDFQIPTPVQTQVIPLLQAENQDIIALAQTGTGKTAAFGLPIMHKVDPQKKHTQALILSPTRELCKQICDDLMNYSKYLQQVNITAVYGGSDIVKQIRQLEKGSQIIVATPGRMMDLIKRGKADLSQLQWFVLDEADEMLSMGFKDDIDSIFESSPVDKNTLLFSATMASDVNKIARSYMQSPVEVTVGTKNSGAENIEHVFYKVRASEKYQVLKRVVDFYPDIYGIVFCRTKIETQDIADALIKDGYSADSLHGDLSQAQRDLVMKKFRNRTIQMLVATDVAARGIDVDDLTHVINYNLPDEIEHYTHRSGRTGRAGKKGISISIIVPAEMSKVRIVEKQIGKKMSPAKIPTGMEVCEKQLFHQIHEMKNVEVDEDEINPYMEKLMEEFDGMSKEDMIKKFVSVEFNRFLSYYKNTEDLNERNDDSQRRNRSTTRMFINLGRMDKFDREQLRRYIAKECGVEPSAIFDIALNQTYSFFETKNEFAEQILNTLNGARFENRKLRVDTDEPNSGNKGGGGGRDRRRGNGDNRGRRNDRNDNRGRSDSRPERREFRSNSNRNEQFRPERKEHRKGGNDRRFGAKKNA